MYVAFPKSSKESEYYSRLLQNQIQTFYFYE